MKMYRYRSWMEIKDLWEEKKHTLTISIDEFGSKFRTIQVSDWKGIKTYRYSILNPFKFGIKDQHRIFYLDGPCSYITMTQENVDFLKLDHGDIVNFKEFIHYFNDKCKLY